MSEKQNKKNQKKINISTDSDKESSVGISKSKRWTDDEKNSLDIKQKVSDLYNKKNLNVLQKPIKTKGISFLLVLIIAIFFGILGGVFGSGYVLEGNELPQWFPFKNNQTIKNQNNLDKEKADQNLSQNSPDDLMQDTVYKPKDISFLKEVTWTIFEDKGEPEDFLRQIYAPWQTKALAVAVKKNGWLLTTAQFQEDKDYVAINSNNDIFNITRKIYDPKTGASLIKIPVQEIKASNILNHINLKPTDDLIVLDKFKNFWTTKVSQPQARNIYETEDLVRSTDELNSGIRLNKGVSLELSPAGVVFKNEHIVGLVKDSSIVPAWILASKINQVIQTKEFSWPYAGLEYLRISEAPGLLSDQFKDLEKGAIVYGDPNENSPGEKADLRNADVIIEVGGTKVKPGVNLSYIFQSQNPGDQISVEFTRQNEKIKTVIDLEKQEF